MDLRDSVLQLSEKIKKQKGRILTEEATKAAFIMPMISALGYDVFNPFEVVPEMGCGLASRMVGKVDYAIMKEGRPALLIECKHCNQNLDLHGTQLAKYYAASSAHFGVLTNGIEYRFYADLERANIMDSKPFWAVDMLDVSDADIGLLKKFHKSCYDERDILSAANGLRYTAGIKAILEREISSPSPAFVRFLARQVYTGGQVTSKVTEMLAPLVKESISGVVSGIVTGRIGPAAKNGGAGVGACPAAPEDDAPEGAADTGKGPDLIPTREEIDAYNMVRSILKQHVDVSRIRYKKFKSYFTVNIDGSVWWWICRISLKKRSKRVGFPMDDYKTNEWVAIGAADGLCKYADRLKAALDIAMSHADYWASRENSQCKEGEE